MEPSLRKRAVSGFDEMTQPVESRVAELEQQAESAYAAGDPEGSVSAWEELYAFHVARGEDLPAARAAAMVAMYLMIDTGLMAPIRAWVRRAVRLIAGVEETPVHAIVAMVCTYERLWCGDMTTAGANAIQAVDLGERLGVAPAVLVGRTAIARLRIFDGDIPEGVEMLDDIALTLLSGEVDPMTSGMVYCEVICAVQGLALYDRAAEWTHAMEHWRERAGFGGFSGRCRVHSAEMLRLTGPCDRAEEVALEACEELRPWMRREFGWPLTELGNIRLRKGDLPGAEEAFLAAHGNSWMPQPGLALLRLAQGDPATAAAMVDDAITHPFNVPSKERPPHGGLRRAPLLDAQVEIAVSIGDLAIARAAADELSEIADTFTSVALHASAELAQGRVALAEGDPHRAAARCEKAVAAWIGVGAPFEAAVAQLVLAVAHHQAGNNELALTERRAAQQTFEIYGAVLWAERAAHSAEDMASPGTPTPQPTAPTSGDEANLFRCNATTRTIRFGGVTVVAGDLKGMRYLERLLAEPNREFHVLDLVAVERGSLPTMPAKSARDLAGDNLTTTDGGNAGLHLDDQARDAYRRRLADIDDDIDDATRANDLARIELAEHDREYLVNELSRAIGLGGRSRQAGATSERARMSVARTIRYAMARIDEHHPSLGQHLRHAISTGSYCEYRPDPRVPICWTV